MGIRAHDNRGRAVEKFKWKNALLLMRFEFQYIGLNKRKVCRKPTSTLTNVFIRFFSAVAR